MFSRHPIQVLLISHNPRDIDLIRAMLSDVVDGEIAVETAPRLPTAFERLAAGGIDLLLLDPDFPDGTGLGVLLQLRECAPAIPVIILAGADNEALAIELLRHGAHDFLVRRALDGPRLARAIRFALERARAERHQRAAHFSKDLPDSIALERERPQASTALASKNFRLDIVLPPREESAVMEAFGRHVGEDGGSAASSPVPAGQFIAGKVIEEMLPDGQIRWILPTRMPLGMTEGQVIGAFSMARDPAEIRRAEQAVGEMEERYRRLLDSVTDYVYTVEMRDGVALSTTHGPGCLTITGYSPEEFNADVNLWNRIIHPEDREMVIEKVQQLIQWGVPLVIEHRLIHKDGQTHWVRNKQVPRHDSQGRLIAYDGLISDITEQKNAERLLLAANDQLQEAVAELVNSHQDLENAHGQLIRAEKLESVGRLAAGVAHEVKNPLAILQMGIQFFAELPHADEETNKMVIDQMREAADRANSVIESLQNFSSSRELETREASVNSIIEETLRLVRLDLVKSSVSLVTHLAPDLPACKLDSASFEQVLLNLINNACHAMPSGGSLTVCTERRKLGAADVEIAHGDRSGRGLREGDTVVALEIRDTGTGIPEEKLPRVFDLFFTTKQTGKGKGLGLAVSRRIIDLHGGQIGISNVDGGGSRVTILLPIAAEAS